MDSLLATNILLIIIAVTLLGIYSNVSNRNRRVF